MLQIVGWPGWVGGWGGKLSFQCLRPFGPQTKSFLYRVPTCQIIIFHSGEKFFFSVVTNFFWFILKWPTVARGHRKKCDRSRLLGTWYLTVFPKKLGTKLFIFHTKHFYGLIVLYLVLALESISGVKSWFFS
jgi:hypothetical protein